MPERCEYVHEFNQRLTSNEERSKSNSHRIDQLEDWKKDQTELIKAVSQMAEKQNTIERDVGVIQKNVQALNEKAGKRWESVVDKAISAIVGGLIAYLLFKLGLG